MFICLFACFLFLFVPLSIPSVACVCTHMYVHVRTYVHMYKDQRLANKHACLVVCLFVRSFTLEGGKKERERREGRGGGDIIIFHCR